MKKRFFASVLSLVMLLSLLPTAAFAADGDNVAKIGNTEYATLKLAVDAATNGAEIILLRDVTDGDGVIVPSGKNITINFAGFTYTVTKNLAGSAGTESQCFQLLKNSTIVMKNGTIKAGNQNVAILIQNYSNLTLDHMTLDGSTMTRQDGTYALSNNNGEIKIADGTTITAQSGNGNIAMDVCWAESYQDGARVTVEEGATINGDVELGLWGQDTYDEGQSALTITGGTVNGSLTVGDYGTGGNTDDKIAEVGKNVTISGGTITSEVPEVYLAPGFVQGEDKVVKINPDGNFKAEVLNGSGSVIGAYGTLQEAITAAASGAEVKLLTDTTEDITVTGKKITLNLNGQKLTNVSSDTITVALGAELTVKGEGTVDNVTDGKGALFNNGTVTLDGGTFDRSKEAGSAKDNPGSNSWYTICNHGAMTINEGVTVTTGSDNVTAVGKFSSLIENGYYNYSSNNPRTGYKADTNQKNPSLTINGGVFNGGINTVKNDDGGKIKITGGEFKNTTQAAVLNWNEAEISGGTFEVKSDNCSVVLNGRNDNNKADNEVLNQGKLTISGGTFIASESVAPIGMMNGNANMSDVTVSGGNYSSSVEKEYLADNKKAELYSTTKEPDAPYSYYASVDDAKEADPTGVVKDLTVVPATGEQEHKLTLDYGYDGKKDKLTGVKFTLPAKPVRSGYTFQGWYNGETKVAGELSLTEDTTVTAKWSRNSSGSGTTTYAITTNSPANGTVTASSKSAAKGATVTLTVAPTEGYQLDKLTVADKDGKEITLTDKGNGKYTFTMPASKVEVTATFKQAPVTHVCPAEKYTDVDTTQWYHEGVDYVIANGMMNGTGTNIFEPNATTTRGMIVTILYRLEKEPAAGTSPFTDVDADQWYAKAVAWAAANGVVNGTSSTTFNPNDPITREQMAAILYRYATFKGYDVTQKADLASYTDASQISAYAKDAMSWANKAGLIGGVSATTLQPQGSATRAQVATILMRFCENVAK